MTLSEYLDMIIPGRRKDREAYRETEEEEADREQWYEENILYHEDREEYWRRRKQRG